VVPNTKTDRLQDVPQRGTLTDHAEAPERLRPDEHIGSPARRLQLELERTWANSEPVHRWSARRSLLFIVLTNGLLWTALVWGVTRII
jgi:hypothetical protein